MRSSPPEPGVRDGLLRKKLDLISDLERSYRDALASLGDREESGLDPILAEAEKTLASLTEIEPLLRERGIETPPSGKAGLATIRELHLVLAGILAGRREEILEERGRLSTFRRCLAGYKVTVAPPRSGERIDGHA